MKVLGKEKDFYDSALDFSNVDQQTWFRDFKVFKINGNLKEAAPEKHKTFVDLKEMSGVRQLNLQISRSDFWGEDLTYLNLHISNGFVLFAGKLYPFVKATDNDKRVEVFFDADTFFKRMESAGLGDHLEQRTEKRWFFSEKFDNMILRDKVNYLFVADNTNYNQIHIDLDNPILIFDYNINKSFYKDTHFQFEANKWDGKADSGYILESGRLSDYFFIKVFDPYRFVQELEMFMGNILIKRDPEPIFTDKDKIQSHGFDQKTSFRKGKTK